MINKPAIKEYQDAIRDRAGDKVSGGQIIKIEPTVDTQGPRIPRQGRRWSRTPPATSPSATGRGITNVGLVGCAGRPSPRSKQGTQMIGERDLRAACPSKWDRKYWPTYKVLDVLQKVFYRSNAAREAFVEMCSSEYVQRMTFDSYLYKTVVPGNPISDLKLLWGTVGSILRSKPLRVSQGPTVTFGGKC